MHSSFPHPCLARSNITLPSEVASGTHNVSYGSASALRTDPLPPGWAEAIDQKSGQRYYYNHLTQQSSWKRPQPAPPRFPSLKETSSKARHFYATDKGLPAQKSSTIAMQIDVCNRYKKGRVQEKSVLKATTACIKQCDLREALQCVKRMRAVSVAPDLIIYSALIPVCMKEGRTDLALAIIKEMRDVDMTPDVIACNVLISALGKAGRADQALDVFKQMDAAGVVPNVTTYNVLITAMGEAGRVDKALAAFYGMKTTGVAPNEVTCNALISAFGKQGRAEEALAVYQEMKAAKIDPNTVTYGALISAFGKQGRADQALALFAEMRIADIAPDGITYSALIAACDKGGRTDQVPVLLQNAIANGVFKASLGYHAGENALNFHANSIFEEYIPYRHEPGVPTGLAKVLFQYHRDQGHIKPGTSFIVGCHGDNYLRDAVQACITACGMRAVTGRFQDGFPNKGKLVAASLISRPVPKSTLNPHAEPFIPSWKIGRPFQKEGIPG